jgi:hypothetical protein
MNAPQEVKMDERTVAVVRAGNTWGLNFIIFALLIDIGYRAGFRNEVAWDLIAMFGISSAINVAYLARHRVLGQVLGNKWVTIGGVVLALVISAVAAFILTMARFK